MKRTNPACRCLLLGVALVAVSATAVGARKPNVLFILMDDLGYGDLTCYNPASDIATPHIDSIADQGVRFSQFYAASNVCAPSRRAILTGRYPGRLGEWAEAYRTTPKDTAVNAKAEPCFPLFLKQAGYVNGMFGKWNVGAVNGVSTPDAQGFDYWIGSHHNTSYFLHRKGGELGLWENGAPCDDYVGTFADDVFVDKAIGFIRENRDKPFLVYLSLFTPHAPFQDPEAYSEVGGYDHRDKPSPGSPSPADRPVAKKMVEHVDKRIGDVLKTLADLGLEGNTLVTFTSDNGGMRAADNQPLSGFKQQMLEGGIRVPSMIKWPGVYPAGRVSDQVGISMDFTRTILAAAGAEQHVPQGRQLDGIDLTPVLTGKAKEIKRSLFWRRREWRHAANALWAEGHVNGDWKYIKEFKQAAGYAKTQQGKYNADGYVEVLFNLKDDIAETTDLAAKRPEKLASMRREFEGWRAETVDRDRHYRIPATDQYGRTAPAAASVAGGAATSSSALTHRYTFEGNVKDMVGAANGKATPAGEHTEAPRFIADIPPGVADGAPTKSLEVGMTPAKKSGFTVPNILSSSAGSCSAWVKPDTLNGGNYVLVAAGFKLMAPKGSANLRAIYNEWTPLGETKIAPGAWTHAALTWSRATSTMAYYVNGTLVESKNDADTAGMSDQGIRVGTFQPAYGGSHLENQFDGKIYDLQFYDNALPRDDVAALYANPGSTIEAPPAPKQAFTMPEVFSSNMVLQRGVPVPVWGQAENGTVVTVSFNGYDLESTARDGKWRVVFPPMPASAEPRVMTVASQKSEIRNPKSEIRNILVGDVWLASGQSNMGMRLAGVKGGKEAIAESANPNLRFFRVDRRLERMPPPMGTTWQVAGPSTSPAMTAVGYHFAREIQETQGIPIGLLQCAFGGTVTETWCSPDVMAQGWPDWEAWQKGALRNPKHPQRNTSSYLYTRMLKTVMPFPVRGFIWYQGSANASRAEEQKKLFPAMVADWRRSWGDENLPVYLVQLPRYEVADWHAFRCAQLDIWKNTPNTFMAVTIDLSKDWNPGNHPIHPTTKAPIGHRLALAARANVYGEKDLVFSGPVVRSMAVKEGRAVLSFDHIGTGLIASDGQPLRGFTISADGETFVAGAAEIRGDNVVVRSADVRKPVAVRYGAETDMGRDKLDVNLANKKDLPASPFTVSRLPGER